MKRSSFKGYFFIFFIVLLITILVLVFLKYRPPAAKVPSAISYAGRPHLIVSNGMTLIHFEGEAGEEWMLRSGIDGERICTFVLTKVPYNHQVKNSSDSASLLTLEKVGSHDKIYFAVPGYDRILGVEERGSILDFAKSIADYYNAPVQFSAKDFRDSFTWKLVGEEPVDAVSIKLDRSNIDVQYLSSKVISIVQY